LLNCEFGQGYLFSHPLPGPEIDELVATQPRW
jgi:EAL domain-containing protein (putative c-di-GMP-specific phosphodiesterase class I)